MLSNSESAAVTAQVIHAQRLPRSLITGSSSTEATRGLQ